VSITVRSPVAGLCRPQAAVGTRVMAITIDGLQVASGVDIFKNAGTYTAVGFASAATAARDQMVIEITAEVRDPPQLLKNPCHSLKSPWNFRTCTMHCTCASFLSSWREVTASLMLTPRINAGRGSNGQRNWPGWAWCGCSCSR
jgi:hypothetical protein